MKDTYIVIYKTKYCRPNQLGWKAHTFENLDDAQKTLEACRRIEPDATWSLEYRTASGSWKMEKIT